MKKEIAKKLSQELRFSYFTSRYWLEFLGKHEKKNGEDLVYLETEPQKFILQYSPKKIENLVGSEIIWATQNEIDFIKSAHIEILKQDQVMSEYYYKTDEILGLEGAQNRRNRYTISLFEKKYKYQIVHSLEKQKTIDFLQKWDQKQQLKTAPYERGLKFCYYLLDKIEEDKNLKAIYVLVEDTLVGFSIGEFLRPNFWIGLHQKIDYTYHGLGRWLFRERAKLFEGVENLALGGAMGDPGIAAYKESLNPSSIEPYYHLVLGKTK